MSDPLYEDIERFLELDDWQLDYVLSALSQYRTSDADLVELLVDHVENMNEHSKKPYFEACLGRYQWVAEYTHTCKAITLASCKYNQVTHPEEVRMLLESNRHIKKHLLDKVLQEERNSRHAKTDNQNFIA